MTASGRSTDRGHVPRAAYGTGLGGLEVVRDGRRVRVAEVQLSAGAVTVCTSSALVLARGDPPSGAIWGPPPWSVPPPEALADPILTCGWARRFALFRAITPLPNGTGPGCATPARWWPVRKRTP